MTINQRIHEVRKQAKMTQQEFADRLKVKRQTVGWMEKDGHNVTEQNIQTICRAFSVNEEWLRNGVGKPERNDKDKALLCLIDAYQLQEPQVDFIRSILDTPAQDIADLTRIVGNMITKRKEHVP